MHPTTTSLLLNLRNPEDSTAWRDLDARYRPVLIGLGRHLGLDEHEAEEAAQETLAEFTRDYLGGKYQREKGRLGRWIVGIARNRIAEAQRRRAALRGLRGDSAIVEIAEVDTLAGVWAAERRRAILTQALREMPERTRVDPRTLRAFELVSIRGVPAAEAAAECGMTPAEVYVAKARVTQHLRRIVDDLTAAYDDDE